MGGTEKQREFLGEVLLDSIRGTLLSESFQGVPLDDSIHLLSKYLLDYRMLHSSRISLPCYLYTPTSEFESLAADMSRFNADQAEQVHRLVIKNLLLGPDFSLDQDL